MAKKEAAPEPEGEKPEGENAESPPAPKGLKKFLSKKMLMIIVPALLLVVGVGGAGAYFFLMKGDAAAEHAAAEEEASLTPPEVAFADIEKLTVNIQGTDNVPTYLQLSVTLELENEEEKKAVEALLPRIKDQFQAYLRALRVEDTTGSAGAIRIREELLRRVNVAAAPYKVRDVLLKDMLTQ